MLRQVLAFRQTQNSLLRTVHVASSALEMLFAGLHILSVRDHDIFIVCPSVHSVSGFVPERGSGVCRAQSVLTSYCMCLSGVCLHSRIHGLAQFFDARVWMSILKSNLMCRCGRGRQSRCSGGALVDYHRLLPTAMCHTVLMNSDNATRQTLVFHPWMQMVGTRRVENFSI
jgi:hypothetical protein